MFAVYGGLSGETHLLNDTAIWALELASEPGGHTFDELMRQAAADTEVTDNEARAALGDIWTTLVDSGLLQRLRESPARV
jgi:PqqD family protein of HPr-rel-A system